MIFVLLLKICNVV